MIEELLFINYCAVKAGYRKNDAEDTTASLAQVQFFFVFLAVEMGILYFLPIEVSDFAMWSVFFLIVVISYLLKGTFKQMTYQNSFAQRYKRLTPEIKKRNKVIGYIFHSFCFSLILSPILLFKIFGDHKL